VLAGDLAGEAQVPESAEPSWPVLGVHVRHGARRGDDPGIRKAFEHRRGAEEVIAVRVGDEDGGHLLACRGHPAGQSPRLVLRQERIHQNRVPHTVDER